MSKTNATTTWAPWSAGAALTRRVRAWNNRGPDENSIHAVGNGRIVALAAGPNRDCLFGPPYSSPNVMQVTVRCDRPATGTARREAGAAIWASATTLV
jgi:hypothetical protein